MKAALMAFFVLSAAVVNRDVVGADWMLPNAPERSALTSPAQTRAEAETTPETPAPQPAPTPGAEPQLVADPAPQPPAAGPAAPVNGDSDASPAGSEAMGTTQPDESQVAESATAAQALLRFSVMVVASDLNVRPVPKRRFLLSEVGSNAAPTVLVTNLKGEAEVSVPPGRYLLEIEKPLVFEDSLYEWRTEIVVAPGATVALELANDNAVVSPKPAPQPSPEAKEPQPKPPDGSPVVISRPSSQEVTYTSPMVIEVPIVAIVQARSMKKKAEAQQQISGLRPLVCEGAVINSLHLTARAPDKKGLQEVALRAVIYVRPGGDKWVTLTYEVFSGKKSLGKAVTKRLDAEEKKTIEEETSFEVKTDKLDMNTPMTLRVTVGVQDNT